MSKPGHRTESRNHQNQNNQSLTEADIQRIKRDVTADTTPLNREFVN